MNKKSAKEMGDIDTFNKWTYNAHDLGTVRIPQFHMHLLSAQLT